MADELVIVPAEHRHLSQVERWATRHEATHTLLMTPRNPAHGISRGQHWAVLRGDEVVAIATLELAERNTGYVSCVVKPSHQRQGIGSQVMEYVLGLPSVKGLSVLRAIVEPADTATQKILNNNGFSRVGYDNEGRLGFTRRPSH